MKIFLAVAFLLTTLSLPTFAEVSEITYSGKVASFDNTKKIVVIETNDGKRVTVPRSAVSQVTIKTGDAVTVKLNKDTMKR